MNNYNQYQLWIDEYFSVNKGKLEKLLQNGEYNHKKEAFIHALGDNKIRTIQQLSEILDKKVIHSGNNNLKKTVLEFYKYLKEKYDVEIESDLKNKKLINSKLIREIEIAKYLHSNPTRDEILDEFNIASTSLKNHLNDLKNGISFLDTNIQVDINNIDGRKLECNSTIHPIFLALNATELYALINYLPRVLKDTNQMNSKCILDIIDKIKPQLTTYASKLVKVEKDDNIINEFTHESSLIHDKDWLIMNIMKRGSICKFVIKNQEICGRLYNYNTIDTLDGKRIQVDNLSKADITIIEE